MAVGVILVFRSHRVINFAIGGDGWLRRRPPRPHGHRLGRAVLAGLRRLPRRRRGRRRGDRAARGPAPVHRAAGDPLVATVGVAQLLLFAQSIAPRPASPSRRTPRRSRSTWEVGGVLVRSEHLVVLVVIPLASPALGLFLSRTRYGTGHPGLGRQPGRGPARRHQHQADVDARLGARRRAGHARRHRRGAAHHRRRRGELFTFGPGVAAAGARRRRRSPRMASLPRGVGRRRWPSALTEAVLVLQQPTSAGCSTRPCSSSCSSRCW